MLILPLYSRNTLFFNDFFLGQAPSRPSATALAQAETLLREQGEERAQEARAAAILEGLPDVQREAYHQRARERLPALMCDLDGLVAMQMRYLVVEDGLVG